MDNPNNEITMEGNIYQMLSDSMPDVLEYGDIFTVDCDTEPKPGEIVLANHNGQIIVRQLGYGSLRSSTTKYKDINLNEIQGVSKIIIHEKGQI